MDQSSNSEYYSNSRLLQQQLISGPTLNPTPFLKSFLRFCSCCNVCHHPLHHQEDDDEDSENKCCFWGWMPFCCNSSRNEALGPLLAPLPAPPNSGGSGNPNSPLSTSRVRDGSFNIGRIGSFGGSSGSFQLDLQRKVVLLGPRDAGKTAIASMCAHHHFDPSYEPTIEQTLRTSFTVKGVNFAIDILDTAGQDQYTNMSRQVICSAHGYVLVYSIESRQSFESIMATRDRLISLVGIENTPMILVGNKRDLVQSRQVPIEAGKKLAKTWGCPFIESSALANENIDQIFITLIQEIEKNSNLFSTPVEETRSLGCCVS